MQRSNNRSTDTSITSGNLYQRRAQNGRNPFDPGLGQYAVWKRGTQYWLVVVVNGERYREPLGTTDWRHARELEKTRVAELQKRPPDPMKRARTFSALSVAHAINVYAADRRSQVSSRMVGWWKEMGRPLAA